MKRAVLCGWLPALLLAGCSLFPSAGPSGREVVAQANPGDHIAFDVVKLDDSVMTVLRAQREPRFHERFKKYIPPPEVKIAVGDVVSVIIWEAASNGLFGNSLAEWSVSPGVASRLLGGATSGIGALSTAGQSLATSSNEVLSQLLGGAAAGQGGAGEGLGAAALALSGLAAPQATAPAGTAGTLQPRMPEVPPGTNARNLQELLQYATETGRPGTRIPDQQVGPDGAISIPYGGRIEAAGRTPAEVQRTIEERLGPRALQPQALVVIRRSLANSVSVAGESVKGARVPLSLGGDRLLQVIAAAGGANAPVHDTFVQLSRGGVSATVPLATLVADPEQNIFAEPGDVLTLLRRPQTFSAFGATGRNAAITFTSDRLTLAEALGKAGGLLDERADPRAVFLFRYEPISLVRALGQPVATEARGDVSPIVYRLDLSDAKSYPLAREFPVRDKDIIFVADADFAGVYKAFAGISNITGPIITGILTCQSTKC